jgi:preprotein translocase SecE subunit
MAKQEEKGNRVLRILTTEYPADRILVVIMGLLVTVVGYYLVSGHVPTGSTQPYLSITNTDAWWNSWIFGTDTGIMIFQIFILLMGIGALIMGLYPYFKPSIKEMKRVTWPSASIIKNHSLRVFGFILFLVSVFILYQIVLYPLFDLFDKWGS